MAGVDAAAHRNRDFDVNGLVVTGLFAKTLHPSFRIPPLVISFNAANEPTAVPPEEFDEYELVVLTRGENPPLLDDKASELLQRQHLEHLRAMLDAGHLKVAAPLDEQPDDSWRGMCLYQVGSVDKARRVTDTSAKM
jgi:hypothetical protein